MAIGALMNSFLPNKLDGTRPGDLHTGTGHSRAGQWEASQGPSQCLPGLPACPPAPHTSTKDVPASPTTPPQVTPGTPDSCALPELSPRIRGGFTSVLGLVDGSVVLVPKGNRRPGPSDSVAPWLCSVVVGAAVAVETVVATVVFRAGGTGGTVGTKARATVCASGASSSPVGPHAMNSGSRVGRPGLKSKVPPRAAARRCRRPRLNSCGSVGAELPAGDATDTADAAVPRDELALAAVGGLASPPLGTRAPT